MSERIIYDEDIYVATNAERSSVENVVFDSKNYIAYVQWNSGDIIYAYNVTRLQWTNFVADVNNLRSVGRALRTNRWGPHFTSYSGWDAYFEPRNTPELAKDNDGDEFEVTLKFTGTVKIKVSAANLIDAVGSATSMFQNDATTGQIEVLDAKKVI